MTKDEARDDPRRTRLAAALRSNLKRRKAGGGAPAQPAERDGDAGEKDDGGEQEP